MPFRLCSRAPRTEIIRPRTITAALANGIGGASRAVSFSSPGPREQGFCPREVFGRADVGPEPLKRECVHPELGRQHRGDRVRDLVFAAGRGLDRGGVLEESRPERPDSRVVPVSGGGSRWGLLVLRVGPIAVNL